MDFDDLLALCHENSEIEKDLLRALYFDLTPDVREELAAQHRVHLPPVTVPDFAFPKWKIAIYCDGYEFHNNQKKFYEDRHQSNELQMLGWLVLRFTGSEIYGEVNEVVKTILRAIELRRGSNRLDDAEIHLADFYFSRGKDDLMINDYDGAIVNLTKAIELSPFFAASYHYRGVAYYFKTEYTLAIDDYNRAIEILPESPGSYN